MRSSLKVFVPFVLSMFLFSACSSNSAEEGIVVTTDLVVGSGEEVQNETTIIIKWEGRLQDGTVFDSSELQENDLIFTLGVGKVIAGLDEGIIGMRIGGKRLIEIPPDKAFGRAGSCPDSGACIVPGNATVTYEVEVIDRMTTVFIDEREVGDGDPVVDGDLVNVEYVGATTNGTVFDSSEAHGSQLQFRVGKSQVIQGWDIGILGMKAGGVRILTIPPELAYGSKANGPVPAWSVLVFRLELVTIVDES